MTQPKHAFAHVEVTSFWDPNGRQGRRYGTGDSLQGLTLV